MSYAPVTRECEAGCGQRIVFERTIAGKWAPLEWPGEPREVFIGEKCPDCGESIEQHVGPAALAEAPCDRAFEGRERRMLVSNAGALIEWTYPVGTGGKPVRAFINHFITCPERERFRKSKPARSGRKEIVD
jgi:hypothetical protein